MIQKIKAFIAFVCLLALAAQGIAANEGPDLRLKGKPSGRDLLSLKSRIFSLQSSGPDTVRILAIRVEFETDTLDVTTGDGKFVLTVPDEPVIDPPPHDKNYFEAQLLALANYYRTVSNGTLVLTYQVFPQENQAAYQLPNDMRYYSPDDETLADQRLAELFRDAFVAADQQDTLPFGTFDSFIVFHAGVGKDISFDFDPTPNDIPSAFLNLNDLADGLANGDPAYQGVAVNNSNFLIQDGIVLPETESQEGYEIGLLGTSAIMMGFQLGLPSLFSAETGASGIGRWGLMDQGSGNFLGLLPAEPSAWEKVFGNSRSRSRTAKIFKLQHHALPSRRIKFTRFRSTRMNTFWSKTASATSTLTILLLALMFWATVLNSPTRKAAAFLPTRPSE